MSASRTAIGDLRAMIAPRTAIGDLRTMIAPRTAIGDLRTMIAPRTAIGDLRVTIERDASGRDHNEYNARRAARDITEAFNSQDAV